MKGREDLLIISIFPLPRILTRSISSGRSSLLRLDRARDLGFGHARVKRSPRASCQDGPLNIANDFAGAAALEERRDTKSILGDHSESCKGNVNAIPGYDRTYNPFPDLQLDVGGIYSPGNVGPINLL